MKRRDVCWITAVVALLLAACQDMPVVPGAIEKRDAFITAAVKANARLGPVCEHPVTPKGLSDGRDWRYGCFCGAGYPAISPQADETALVAKYFAIGFKDDIDRACRNHDVCWVHFGDGDGPCTQMLDRDIQKLFDAFVERLGQSPPKAEANHIHRCMQVILDIGRVFSTAFAPYDYANAGDWLSGTFARVVFATPILGATGLVDLLRSPEYPGADEVCSLPTARPGHE